MIGIKNIDIWTNNFNNVNAVCLEKGETISNLKEEFLKCIKNDTEIPENWLDPDDPNFDGSDTLTEFKETMKVALAEDGFIEEKIPTFSAKELAKIIYNNLKENW